jgi:hypothetical protein
MSFLSDTIYIIGVVFSMPSCFKEILYPPKHKPRLFIELGGQIHGPFFAALAGLHFDNSFVIDFHIIELYLLEKRGNSIRM